MLNGSPSTVVGSSASSGPRNSDTSIGVPLLSSRRMTYSRVDELAVARRLPVRSSMRKLMRRSLPVRLRSAGVPHDLFGLIEQLLLIPAADERLDRPNVEDAGRRDVLLNRLDALAAKLA